MSKRMPSLDLALCSAGSSPTVPDFDQDDKTAGATIKGMCMVDPHPWPMWCVVQRDTFTFYQHEKSTQPVGIVNMRGAKVKKSKKVIKMIDVRKALHLITPIEPDVASWLFALKQAVSFTGERSSPSSSSSSSSTSSSFQAHKGVFKVRSLEPFISVVSPRSHSSSPDTGTKPRSIRLFGRKSSHGDLRKEMDLIGEVESEPMTDRAHIRGAAAKAKESNGKRLSRSKDKPFITSPTGSSSSSSYIFEMPSLPVSPRRPSLQLTLPSRSHMAYLKELTIPLAFSSSFVYSIRTSSSSPTSIPSSASSFALSSSSSSSSPHPHSMSRTNSLSLPGPAHFNGVNLSASGGTTNGMMNGSVSGVGTAKVETATLHDLLKLFLVWPYEIDSSDLRDFLLGSRLFFLPSEIFEALNLVLSLSEFSSLPNFDIENALFEFIKNVAMMWKTINLDFGHPDLRQTVMQICNTFLTSNRLREIDSLLPPPSDASALSAVAVVTKPGTSVSITHNFADIFNTSTPQDIAQQMTLMESAMIADIQLPEFIIQLNSKDLAPRIQILHERFNQMSLWVSTSILTGESMEARAEMYKLFCDLGLELLKLNNFNSLAQIMSGFDNIAIDRLKPLHDNLPSKTKDTAKHLSDIVSPTDNYRAYRSYSSLSPRIPFIAVHMRDLQVIHECNPTFVDQSVGSINFDKVKQISKAVCSIKDADTLSYPSLKPNRHLQKMLSEMQSLDEEQLYKLSVLMHPISRSS